MIRDRKYGYVFGLLGCYLVVVPAAYFIIGCGESHGAPRRVCNVRRAPQHAVALAAPYVAPSLAYQTPVGYLIGQQVRNVAADEYGFRNSPGQSELDQLRAWKAGVDQAERLAQQAQAQQQQPWPQQPAEQPEQQPLPPVASAAPQTWTPMPADPAKPFANSMPTLIAHCSKCHSGAEPKGGQHIDGTVDLAAADAADQRDAIVRAIWNGHMPPSGQEPVDIKAFHWMLDELYPEAPQADEPAKEQAAPPATPPQNWRPPQTY